MVLEYLYFTGSFKYGVNLRNFQQKGLALPFFSYGGSNYLVSILSISIMLRIYRDVYKKSINSSIR
jgi:cell division protein FtsW (lipid II flippase)